MIPQDGRIDLAFNLRWKEMLDQQRWPLSIPTRLELKFPEAMNISTDSTNIRQQFLIKEGKEEVRRLSRFLMDFLKHGTFQVWDFSPPLSHSPDNYVKETTVLGGLTARSLEGRVYSVEDFSFRWQHVKDYPNGTFPTSRGIASWNRLILLEGLTDVTTTSSPTDFLLPPWDFSDDLVAKAVHQHLECRRRGDSRATNPYTLPRYNLGQTRHPFHITFYEKLTDANIALDGKESGSMTIHLDKEKIRIGTLYERQDTGPTASRVHSTSNNTKQDLTARAFRHSAITIFTEERDVFSEPSGTEEDTMNSSDCSKSPVEYWTTLLLTPTGFRFRPYDSTLPVYGYSSASELFIIVRCLEIVESRWIGLLKYFDGLLDEDFMDSEAYTRLIFDDDKLSRSKLYFWTFSCLNEFITSIDDTKNQWNFFIKARFSYHYRLINDPEQLDRLINDPEQLDPLDRHLVRLLQEGERYRQGLEHIQAEFRAKIGIVETLRNGLFNASALIESRSSTRLGQNVQLLTYISIFYLPLGFCAALWAVPNIDDIKTRIPFAITTSLVCLITFAVVFNLNNIANALGKTYFDRRQRLVDEMKDDPNSEWHERRQWFEEFPPNNDRKSHSEWWIVRYQFSKWFRRRKNAAEEKKSEEDQP
ncbi:hypothetical protein QBC32DRAFT_62823 [Pseudoneurospora amorphoporcata]|uniref:Uncharacterized protein n=1 Tax=Pseudoneurospora amorphoporcata TaxID=241081 RepID=A0AAN6SCU3_9PEZI|nr:hypothetical protein QBC32DRAFT_62823 [Pseudoneurospora amorphoporcata]